MLTISSIPTSACGTARVSARWWDCPKAGCLQLPWRSMATPSPAISSSIMCTCGARAEFVPGSYCCSLPRGSVSPGGGRLPEPESDLFSDWLRHTAAATPDAPAIVEEDRATSFRELFEHSASLALRFVEHGIQKQDRIALVLPKTTEAIISVFASLLAGAVYVPIHPQWPKERIETTLADCAARLVIEADKEGDRFPPRITDRETGASIPWQATPGAP